MIVSVAFSVLFIRYGHGFETSDVLGPPYSSSSKSRICCDVLSHKSLAAVGVQPESDSDSDFTSSSFLSSGFPFCDFFTKYDSIVILDF